MYRQIGWFNLIGKKKRLHHIKKLNIHILPRLRIITVMIKLTNLFTPKFKEKE